jgi:hypothetical protein
MGPRTEEDQMCCSEIKIFPKEAQPRQVKMVYRVPYWRSTGRHRTQEERMKEGGEMVGMMIAI